MKSARENRNDYIIKDFTEYSSQEVLREGLLHLWWIVTHLVNLASTLLADDFLSCRLRASLLKLLGVRTGARTTVRGVTFLPGKRLKGGTVLIGTKTFINRGCRFDPGALITIGNNVAVGHGVTFVGAGHEIAEFGQRHGPVQGLPIVISDGVWIGANATILGGVTIGRGAVVGAGAVVTKDVPPDVFVAGVPAKMIRVMRELEAT